MVREEEFEKITPNDFREGNFFFTELSFQS